MYFEQSKVLRDIRGNVLYRLHYYYKRPVAQRLYKSSEVAVERDQREEVVDEEMTSPIGLLY